MTQVKVIITKERVYTTFYKTIHLSEKYRGDTSIDDRYNDKSTANARSLAFSLACTDSRPSCAIIDWSDKKVTDKDVFHYLNECHPEPIKPKVQQFYDPR